MWQKNISAKSSKMCLLAINKYFILIVTDMPVPAGLSMDLARMDMTFHFFCSDWLTLKDINQTEFYMSKLNQ